MSHPPWQTDQSSCRPFGPQTQQPGSTQWMAPSGFASWGILFLQHPACPHGGECGSHCLFGGGCLVAQCLSRSNMKRTSWWRGANQGQQQSAQWRQWPAKWSKPVLVKEVVAAVDSRWRTQSCTLSRPGRSQAFASPIYSMAPRPSRARPTETGQETKWPLADQCHCH